MMVAATVPDHLTEPDEDLHVKQKDLLKATGASCAVEDPVTLNFLTRMGRNPDQVIR